MAKRKPHSDTDSSLPLTLRCPPTSPPTTQMGTQTDTLSRPLISWALHQSLSSTQITFLTGTLLCTLLTTHTHRYRYTTVERTMNGSSSNQHDQNSSRFRSHKADYVLVSGDWLHQIGAAVLHSGSPPSQGLPLLSSPRRVKPPDVNVPFCCAHEAAWRAKQLSGSWCGPCSCPVDSWQKHFGIQILCAMQAVSYSETTSGKPQSFLSSFFLLFIKAHEEEVYL